MHIPLLLCCCSDSTPGLCLDFLLDCHLFVAGRGLVTSPDIPADRLYPMKYPPGLFFFFFFFFFFKFLPDFAMPCYVLERFKTWLRQSYKTKTRLLCELVMTRVSISVSIVIRLQALGCQTSKLAQNGTNERSSRMENRLVPRPFAQQRFCNSSTSD